MRILVASQYAIPGMSGGWTTPLDLLGPNHEVTYLVARGRRRGRYRLEGVEVFCPWLCFPLTRGMISKPNLIARCAAKLNRVAFQRLLQRLTAGHRYDCLMCLETTTAILALRLGLRYILRLHDHPDTSSYEQARKGAILVTSVDPSVPGARYLPHAIDVSRYDFSDPPAAQSAVLLAALDPATSPLTFVRAVSRSVVPGTVYGDGVLKAEVAGACRATKGKVAYAGPVLRLQLNEVYKRHQIGVACIGRAKNPYIMKISDYQACGLFPVVQQGTHLALDRPDLCRVFQTEEELTEQINWVHAHWQQLREIRLANRRYVEEKYDIKEPRKMFEAWLAELRRDGKLLLR